jgi:hypothetical protein
MRLPCRWRDGGLENFAGTVRFRRRFGYPGKIDDYERVWLTFAGFEGQADLSLNGHALGRYTARPVELDVTSLLAKRNQVDVVIESATEEGGLWDEVALEVRCTAYLRGFHAWIDAEARCLHVSGEVVGTADRPLELYVMADRHSIGYAVVEPDPAGKVYHQVLEIPQTVPAQLRVDLVNVAQIWYATEVPVSPPIR